MSTGMIAFIIPIVCVTLALVTNILKTLKRMASQIDKMEIKLLEMEGKVH
jgi:hypothetical protein